jgi:hypothetical protein
MSRFDSLFPSFAKDSMKKTTRNRRFERLRVVLYKALGTVFIFCD